MSYPLWLDQHCNNGKRTLQMKSQQTTKPDTHVHNHTGNTSNTLRTARLPHLQRHCGHTGRVDTAALEDFPPDDAMNDVAPLSLPPNAEGPLASGTRHPPPGHLAAGGSTGRGLWGRRRRGRVWAFFGGRTGLLRQRLRAVSGGGQCERSVRSGRAEPAEQSADEAARRGRAPPRTHASSRRAVVADPCRRTLTRPTTRALQLAVAGKEERRIWGRKKREERGLKKRGEGFEPWVMEGDAAHGREARERSAWKPGVGHVEDLRCGSSHLTEL